MALLSHYNFNQKYQFGALTMNGSVCFDEFVSQNLFLTFIVAILGWFTPIAWTPPNYPPFLYWPDGAPKAPPGGGLLFPCDY